MKTEFYKDAGTKDGLRGKCKPCTNNTMNQYYKDNKQFVRKLQKEYYDLTVNERRSASRNYGKKHRKELSLKDKIRKKTDINFYLAGNLRIRMYQALKTNQKTGSAVSDLGCSIDELKTHLEKQFQPGMTWENKGKWHIDHIIPLSSFDLSVREQFLKACHYTNLQPLWAEDNLKKSNKLIKKDK